VKYESDYIKWKNWQERFGNFGPGESFYFDRIFNKPKNLDILEVGFGNGELLTYLNKKNRVIGVELNEQLVKKANEQGIKSFNSFTKVNDSFDIIVAFDVCEHMDYSELLVFFEWLSNHLNQNGVIYLRFPEGGSPFGLLNQNGDFTHKTSLTHEKIRALCESSSLKIQRYFDDDLIPSNKLSRLGFFGKLIILSMQKYSKAFKIIFKIIFYPLFGKTNLATNSIVIIKQ
jgi:2-polyprenyl-3-methyl-5-hydroxy-6-metoxy-1,4-benzoquinol methylase